jgi:phage terminase large subunit-like protein
MKWSADNSYLLEYLGRIESGEIPAGQDMWMELDNLKEDMLSGEYIFDRKDALIRINFIENCVKLTKSPFYGQPMQLMLWQKAFIEAVYSFKMADGFDRFLEVLMLIARKNGKTEVIAALDFAEMIIGGVGLDIVCSGTNDGTADLAYSTIDTMRILVDPKSKDTWRNQKGMKCFATNNKIWKLSDSSKQKEGRAIDIASIDEVWALTDDGIYKPIQQSTSTKERYKIFMFGSEGFVNDGFLDQKRKEYEKIIRGEDCKDSSKRKLPWLYTQDSEMEVWNTDSDGISRAWIKSNPSLGTVKKWSYMKDRVEEARESKGDRIFVLSKDFNIKTSRSANWLNIEDYNYECEFNPEDLRGCVALGAVDLAETTDLCAAKVLVMKKDDPKKYIISHYFIPESKLEEHDDTGAGAKYTEWAEAGLLTITDGTDIDLSVVADWFYQLYTDFGIRMWKCGYDQRFAKDWITRMEFYGWSKTGGGDSDLIMINQNAVTLSNAIRTVEADFKHKMIWYGNNEMDRWNFGNAGIMIDKRGQALIVKIETEKRIDGAVCLAILYETFRRYRTDYRQMVEGK